VIPLGATIRDESGRLLFANAFLTHAESKGDPAAAGKAWAKRQADVDRQVFADGTSADYTAETGKGDGQRYFHCFVFLLPDAPTHERRVATLIIDITSQKVVAIEAQMLSERRRKFLEVQREFISMVSHEFRTPMTTIHGAQYLVEKLFKKLAKANTSGAENLERWLGMQASALATLRTLVDQVLMLNRTEHMTGQTSLELLSPGEVLEETVERINDPMDPPRVVLSNGVPEEFAAFFDPALVKAAAENLISNGLKYSADGAQVNVRVYTEPNGWVLEVADKGRGIPAGDQASLFKPFFRAGNVGSVPGTGLGLAIVRRAVDFHGGHIIFESDTKSGTRFELHFPNVAIRRGGEIRSGSAPLIEAENRDT
jgi:signal transduction histidine kinase